MNLTIDADYRTIRGPGGSAQLRRHEFKIVEALAQAKRPDGRYRPLSRPALSALLWGHQHRTSEALRAHIYAIRIALREVGASVAVRNLCGDGWYLEEIATTETAENKGENRHA